MLSRGEDSHAPTKKGREVGLHTYRGELGFLSLASQNKLTSKNKLLCPGFCDWVENHHATFRLLHIAEWPLDATISSMLSGLYNQINPLSDGKHHPLAASRLF